ncbi:MAG: hypothetical protein AAGA20_20300, partial [Planctomycetota bacterium]
KRFYVHHGSYKARVHTAPIPRYRCRGCRRTFSRQTFRLSYRDRKPHLNARVAWALASGLWFRKTARDVGMTRNNLEKKARKHFRHLHRLNRNLLRRGPLLPRDPVDGPLTFQFDEFESYETRRNTRPVTIATAIEKDSRFMIAAIVAPIRPHGRMTKQRLAAIAEDEARFGRRQHLSRLACLIALRRAATFRPEETDVALETDEKPSYAEIAKAAFHGKKLVHSTTPGRAPRGAGTRLFPINQAEAKGRMHLGRIQREMPYGTKWRRYLSRHLELHVAWRNWVRPRFYRDDAKTPAEFAGYAERPMAKSELLGWRQDWGAMSPCPFGHGGRTVGEAPRGRRRAA